jgi:hypothetical protein
MLDSPARPLLNPFATGVRNGDKADSPERLVLSIGQL